jgi:lysophospholipase L1-like esterase
MQRAEFWDYQIRTFEKADREQTPVKGSIVFTGSSSIRYWQTLEEDMAPLPVINRGFGGSQLAHVIHYAERIVFPHHPRLIVLYAGENDLCWPSLKSPETVFADFQRFVELVRAQRFGTHVYFLSIKRTRFRRGRWAEIDQANQLIEAFAGDSPDVTYVDVSTPMLDAAGHPCPKYLPWYRIHLTDEGYKLWTSIVTPVLEKGLHSEPGLSSSPGERTSQNACGTRAYDGGEAALGYDDHRVDGAP